MQFSSCTCDLHSQPRRNARLHRPPAFPWKHHAAIPPLCRFLFVLAGQPNTGGGHDGTTDGTREEEDIGRAGRHMRKPGGPSRAVPHRSSLTLEEARILLPRKTRSSPTPRPWPHRTTPRLQPPSCPSRIRCGSTASASKRSGTPAALPPPDSRAARPSPCPPPRRRAHPPLPYHRRSIRTPTLGRKGSVLKTGAASTLSGLPGESR